MRARDVIARAMRAASSVLLLQTLAEFSNVAIRKARISVTIFEGQLTLGAPCCGYKRLMTAIFWQPLKAMRVHRLAFWDAMLWASARRAGVRHLLTEDSQDGLVLQSVTFINPFKPGK
jgi:predicted nucleic acid-binding protein